MYNRYMKFTINEFHKQYPDDDACLNEIFRQRYGSWKICPICEVETKFHKISKRKCYSCQNCGYQLHPLANTIYHKSSTPLKNWFYAMYLFSVSKNGVSAKELQRQIGCTYKTAWRMAKQIRLLMSQVKDIFSDTVEIDETYVGGHRKGKRGRGADGKTSVLGIVQRKSKLMAEVVSDTKSKTVKPIIRSNVKLGTTIVTDEYRSYRGLQREYNHKTVCHGVGEYVVENMHTNTIEGFWSIIKRSISGTYVSVSPKYLQSYLNEFSYRYNYHKENLPMFTHLLSRVGMTASQAH